MIEVTMILYKVITKDRLSVLDYINKNNKYIIKYEKNSIVMANKKTLGIFCFSNKYYARNFINNYCPFFTSNIKNFKIIKVKPLYKPKRNNISIVKFISNKSLDWFYNNMQLNKQSAKLQQFKPPEGTICCKKIYVLE